MSDTETATRTEIVLPGTVEPEGLQVRRGPLPIPGRGQVVVRMEATGVSFAEQQMRRGRYFDQPPFPFVPGYDVVGVVDGLGAGVDPALAGLRVAALTKVGSWSSHVLVAAADVVPVPAGLAAADAETVVVNGITAWQMLHRRARVAAGQTVLVHGANGGVGSTLVQLALLAGVRVIGTASARHHENLREQGVIPVDYREPDLAAAVRRHAPGGVDAVFDHLGGDSLARSWRLLAPGGTLVAYGVATALDDHGNRQLPVLKMVLRTLVWTLLPNRRRAATYNIWAGRALTPGRFRARLRADLTQVLEAMAAGRLTARVAARFPLAQAAEAMRLAESGTVAGKIVLVP